MRTLIGLAESSDETAATRYYEAARDAFQGLLEASPPPDPALERQAKLRLATALRKLNQHQEAINLFEAVLKEQNALLNVQAEAATTYQEAGEYGALRLFDYAIKGGRKDEETGKNTIWGWEAIAVTHCRPEETECGKETAIQRCFL